MGFGPAWCAAPAERLRVRSGRRPWEMRRLCQDDVPSTETPSRRAGRKRRFSEQGTWDEGAAAGEQWPPGSSGRTPSSSRPPRPGPVCADASCERSRVRTPRSGGHAGPFRLFAVEGDTAGDSGTRASSRFISVTGGDQRVVESLAVKQHRFTISQFWGAAVSPLLQAPRVPRAMATFPSKPEYSIF